MDHEYKQRDHSKDSPFIHSATNKNDSSGGNKKSPEDKSSKEMFDIVSSWIIRN